MGEYQPVMRGEVEEDLEETTLSKYPRMTHTTDLVSEIGVSCKHTPATLCSSQSLSMIVFFFFFQISTKTNVLKVVPS